ncbi:hypothetical protein U1Q18_011521 [Sarracenia purpurea var. burkii]
MLYERRRIQQKIKEESQATVVVFNIGGSEFQNGDPVANWDSVISTLDLVRTATDLKGRRPGRGDRRRKTGSELAARISTDHRLSFGRSEVFSGEVDNTEGRFREEEAHVGEELAWENYSVLQSKRKSRDP